jgi:hypothetical protein
MIASTADIITAVTETLSKSILPHFETATWAASDIRACLVLLAYLQDRVAHAGQTLVADNEALRSMLEEVASGPDMPPVDADLREDIAQVLQAAPVRLDFAPIEQLERDNEFYQSLLSRVSRRLFEGREAIDQLLYANFRGRLRACLEGVHARDFAVAAKAQALVPF